MTAIQFDEAVEIGRQIADLQKQIDALRKQKRRLYMREYMQNYNRADQGERNRVQFQKSPKTDRREYMKNLRSSPEYKLRRKLREAGLDKAAIAAEVELFRGQTAM